MLVDQFGRPVAWSQFYQSGYTRHRTILPSNTTDSRQTLSSGTRRQLLSHARYLYANVGFIKGAINDIATFSLGNGIELQSLIADPAAREDFETYWRAWVNVADFNGQFTLDELDRMASIAIDRDGDIGFAMTTNDDGEPRLQAIESHRIEDDPDRPGTVDGVGLDRKGRVAFYRVSSAAADGQKNWRDVPAWGFLLRRESERPDELRGKTALAHAVNNARDVLDLLNYEKDAVKVQRAPAMALKTKGGAAVGGGYFGTATTATDDSGSSLTTEQLRSGAILRLEKDEELQHFDSDRPNPTFTGFLDYLDEDVAVGLEVPVHFVKGLHKVSNGTVQRFLLNKAQKKFERRAWASVRFRKRVRFFVLGMAIARGDLLPVPDWWAVRPQLPAKITVDVGRVAQQNREDLMIGSRTLAKDVGEQGEDWEDIRAQQAIENQDAVKRAVELQKFAAKQGAVLTFDAALNLVSRRNNGNPAQQAGATAAPAQTTKEEE